MPKVDFKYPEDGDAEPVLTRDRWADTPQYEKCQRRFAAVSRDRNQTLPMLELRLAVLRDAIREVAERMDFATVAVVIATMRFSRKIRTGATKPS